MAKKDRQIVEVEWLDSSSISGSVWVDKRDAMSGKPCKCRSVGFLAKTTKKSIVLYAHESPYQVGGDMAIPRSAITKIRQLK